MSTNSDISSKLIGLATVRTSDQPKLFNFCRKSFTNLSKKYIRDCFVQGLVRVNGRNVRFGHSDESLRLQEGSQVEIYEKILTIVTDNGFRAILSGTSLIIGYKNAGVSNSGEYFNKMVESMFDDVHVHSIYRLSKGLQGLSIFVADAALAATLRKRIVEKQVLLRYTCIVCGFMAPVTNQVQVACVYDDLTIYTVTVRRIEHCRATEHISLVDVGFNFSISDSYDTEKYITKCIRGVKKSLFHIGHPIVGDHRMVKSSKGLYAALCGLSFDVNTCEEMATHNGGIDFPSTVEVPEPPKFQKLLEREKQMWEAAAMREKKLQGNFSISGDAHGHQPNVAHTGNIDDCVTEYGRTRDRAYNTKDLDAGDCSDDDNSGSEHNYEETDGDVYEDSENEDDTEDVDHSHGYSDSRTHKLKSTPHSNFYYKSPPGAPHEPLAIPLPAEYLTGVAEFCSLRFCVSPSVMIPRRSSECLVRVAIDLLHGRILDASTLSGVQPVRDRSGQYFSSAVNQREDHAVLHECRVLDLGTGSGCLVLSCLHGLLKQKQQQQQQQPMRVATSVALLPASGGATDASCTVAHSVDPHDSVGKEEIQSDATSVCVNSVPDSEPPSVLQMIDGSDCSSSAGGSRRECYGFRKDQECQCTVASVHSATRTVSRVTVTGVGVDISHEALEVAKMNARLLGLEKCCSFVQGSFFDLSFLRSWSGTLCHEDEHGKVVGTACHRDEIEAVAAIATAPLHPPLPSLPSMAFAEVGEQPAPTSVGAASHRDDLSTVCCESIVSTCGPFDVIVCNPPYSSKKEIHRLSVRHRTHEPALALFADGDPLAAYKSIAAALQTSIECHDAPVPVSRGVDTHTATSPHPNPLSMNTHTGTLLAHCGMADSSRWDDAPVVSHAAAALAKGEGSLSSSGLLRRGGFVVLEVGSGQADSVKRIFRNVLGLSFVRSERDHLGIVRCLVFVKS